MAIDSLYDHPLYYDILFGWDRSREADFYHAAFGRCGVGACERVLEVACGTGQVARLLARRRWAVTGLDLRAGMLAFLREGAAAEGLSVETLCADMTAFRAASRFAAAYNPLSSFRLLPSDALAEAHLRATAAALRPGGVYVLDMDFASGADAPAVTTDEAWEMTRGGVTVRADDDAVHVNDGGVERVLAWAEGTHLRGYTADAFAERVARSVELRIESWHPEVSRASGVSEFSVDVRATPPLIGRAMVVLRRK